MKIFHEIDPWDLECSEKHLWGLALGTIFAFTVGIALLVYPSLFLQPVMLAGGTVRKLFVGFCVLASLLFLYLLERHFLITRLRRQLKEEKKKARLAHDESTTSVLATLPKFKEFRNRVALEYHRAEHTGQCLTLLLVALTLRRDLAEKAEARDIIEKAAQAMVRKLRGEDAVYWISETSFCTVLPGVGNETARLISGRVSEGLHAASGFGIRYSFEARTLNYPTDVQNELGIDALVRPYLDEMDRDAMEVKPVAPPPGQDPPAQ